jgi:YHS domain-containing protein
LLLRLLFFVLLVFLLLALIKGYLARSRGAARRRPPIDAEEMAMDPQCQSYVPKRDAIEAGGNFFCSRECAQRFLAGQRK